MVDDYEYDARTDRESAAALLHALADGVAAGAVSLGDDERTVGLPEEFDLGVEFETEGRARELEVELEWPADPEGGEAADGTTEGPDADDAEGADADDERADAEAGAVGGTDDDPGDADPPAVSEPAVGTAARNASLGRFELFEDNAGEWRWRLVHHDGTVVAASGEGYTRKHNARKGLRSVMRNAPGADVTERTE